MVAIDEHGEGQSLVSVEDHTWFLRLWLSKESDPYLVRDHFEEDPYLTMLKEVRCLVV